jgi:hypothetical protein
MLDKFRKLFVGVVSNAESFYSALGLFFALVGVVVGILAIGFEKRTVPTGDTRLEFQRVLEAYRNSIDETQKRIDEITNLTKQFGIDKISDEELKSLIKNDLMSRLGLIEERMRRIEEFIVEKPDRALAVVSMRKDVDLLRSNTDEKITLIRTDIDRAYNIIGWSLGALFIAIVTLLISTFLASRHKAQGS